MANPDRWKRLWAFVSAVSTIGGVISTGILVLGTTGLAVTIVDAIVGIDLPWEDFPAALAFAASIVLALVALDLRRLRMDVNATGETVDHLTEEFEAEISRMHDGMVALREAAVRMAAQRRPPYMESVTAFYDEQRWTVNHNMGFVPEVSAVDEDDNVLIPITRVNTADETVLTFDRPVTGILTLSVVR